MGYCQLFVQYPNVGNAGHIFLVPPGPKDVQVCANISTSIQTLLCRSENKGDQPVFLQGDSWLAVCFPVVQILKDKGDRDSRINIAVYGIDVPANKDIIPSLKKTLEALLPEVQSVVKRLGYLDQHASRFQEVPEMEKWCKNPVFEAVRVRGHGPNTGLLPIKLVIGRAIMLGVILSVIVYCILLNLGGNVQTKRSKWPKARNYLKTNQKQYSDTEIEISLKKFNISSDEAFVKRLGEKEDKDAKKYSIIIGNYRGYLNKNDYLMFDAKQIDPDIWEILSTFNRLFPFRDIKTKLDKEFEKSILDYSKNEYKEGVNKILHDISVKHGNVFKINGKASSIKAISEINKNVNKIEVVNNIRDKFSKFRDEMIKIKQDKEFISVDAFFERICGDIEEISKDS